MISIDSHYNGGIVFREPRGIYYGWVVISPRDCFNIQDDPSLILREEKKRRELAGIKAAQRKHERIKISACKTTRKVLKYYREPRFNAVNVKMEVEK